jgi:hypothetical protein
MEDIHRKERYHYLPDKGTDHIMASVRACQSVKEYSSGDG